jgi:hypothetical protein
MKLNKVLVFKLHEIKQSIDLYQIKVVFVFKFPQTEQSVGRLSFKSNNIQRNPHCLQMLLNVFPLNPLKVYTEDVIYIPQKECISRVRLEFG